MAVECPDCDLCYVPDDPDDAAFHAKHHQEVTAPDRPEPDSRIAVLVDPVSGLLVFGRRDPHFLHEKLYRISCRFNREMKFDQADWAPKGNQQKPGAIGVLFCDDDGRTLGGAGVYEDPAIRGVSCMIAWIWIAPTYRRTGVLRRAMPELVKRFPGAFFQPGYSEAMERFAEKSPYIVNKNGPLFLIE